MCVNSVRFSSCELFLRPPLAARKTLLHYLQETNGEAHLFLTEYLSQNGPPAVDSGNTARDWLARLAAQPVAVMRDPNPATPRTETREVSPRDLTERLLALRLDVAAEVASDLDRVPTANSAILLATLKLTNPLEE